MQNHEIQIIWTEKASANLDFFAEQIRDQSGFDDVAERFYEKVLNRVSRLRTKPEWIGIPVKEYPGAGYKSLFVMDYRIILENAVTNIQSFAQRTQRTAEKHREYRKISVLFEIDCSAICPWSCRKYPHQKGESIS